MKNAKVPILGFAAFSGTGKTTLLANLIPILRENGLKIGLIKHSHHNFDIDKPGKDSHRLRSAGASPVMLVSRFRRAVITEYQDTGEPRLDDQLAYFDQRDIDLLLVEGFKREQFPKIELHRPSLGKPLLYPHDDTIIAVASDAELSLPPRVVPLDINRPGEVADFIVTRYLKAS